MGYSETNTDIVQILDKPRCVLAPKAFGKNISFEVFTGEEAGELIREVW
jgi:hypothetical protein